MGATALEFRLRMVINAAIIVLGFWAPWVSPEKRVLVFEWLPIELARLRIMPFSMAVPALLVVAGLVSALAAILRVWGAACLSPAVVTHRDMKAGSVVANGPYRYLRNPLYVGVWCMVAAITPLMPPSGALFSMVLLTIFLVRLTLGEEAFLSSRLGERYQAYLRAVPRFLPRLGSNIPPGAARPQWARALLSEVTPLGVFVAVVALAFSYDARLAGRIVLIGFGLSLLVRAFLPRAAEPTPSA